MRGIFQMDACIRGQILLQHTYVRMLIPKRARQEFLVKNWPEPPRTNGGLRKEKGTGGENMKKRQAACFYDEIEVSNSINPGLNTQVENGSMAK